MGTTTTTTIKLAMRENGLLPSDLKVYLQFRTRGPDHPQLIWWQAEIYISPPLQSNSHTASIYAVGRKPHEIRKIRVNYYQGIEQREFVVFPEIDKKGRIKTIVIPGDGDDYWTTKLRELAYGVPDENTNVGLDD